MVHIYIRSIHCCNFFEATRRDSKKLLAIGERVGIDVLPTMGPFLLKDTQGMGMVVSILLRSLDKGRYQKTPQFETARKMRLAFSNVWHSSTHTLTTSVLARDIRKTYVISCPTYTLWFERFMSGMHKRMGDAVKQDNAITLDAIHRLVECLEAEYILADSDAERE